MRSGIICPQKAFLLFFVPTLQNYFITRELNASIYYKKSPKVIDSQLICIVNQMDKIGMTTHCLTGVCPSV